MSGRRLPLLAILVAALVPLGGCMLNIPLLGYERQRHMVEETIVPADCFWTTDKVLLASIDGMITDSPDSGRPFSQPSVLVRLKDVLQKAESDAAVRAVIIRVNSPGGFVTASDLLYEEVRRFKEKTHKKVVFFFMDMAASGAYYAAMAGDRIVACPTNVTGSIGVIALFPSLQGLTGKLGVNMRVVKSGEFKDIGSMWRDFSASDRAILQNTIDTMYERFLKIVAEGRPNLDAKTIRRLADGRIYTAQQAKEYGLIDEIGYMDDALKAAKKLAGIRDASLVAYRRPLGYVGHYYASMEGNSSTAVTPQVGAGTQVNLLNIDMSGLVNQSGGPFCYLWLP